MSDGLHKRSLPRRDNHRGVTQLSTQDTFIFSGTTTDPSKGSVARDEMVWRRVGDTMEIHGAYRQTTVGTGGSGNLLVEVPGGFSIDSTKQVLDTNNDPDEAYAIVGQCWPQTLTAGARNGWGWVQAYDATHFLFTSYDSGNFNALTIDANFLSLRAAFALVFSAQIPIVGWR